MAEEEKKEEVPYQFTPEGGAAGNSSKDYTGKGLANYPNGEIYEGEYANGVNIM
jgi:radial spoke head protein 1